MKCAADCFVQARLCKTLQNTSRKSNRTKPKYDFRDLTASVTNTYFPFNHNLFLILQPYKINSHSFVCLCINREDWQPWMSSLHVELNAYGCVTSVAADGIEKDGSGSHEWNPIKNHVTYALRSKTSLSMSDLHSRSSPVMLIEAFWNRSTKYICRAALIWCYVSI